MELIYESKTTVTEAEYRFQLSDGLVVIYKEWLNDSGKVIDAVLRSKQGYDIDDAALLEKIQEEVDKKLKTINDEN